MKLLSFGLKLLQATKLTANHERLRTMLITHQQNACNQKQVVGIHRETKHTEWRNQKPLIIKRLILAGLLINFS